MKKYRKIIHDLFLVVIGNFFLALSINALVIPNDILTGGLAGLSVGLKPFIPMMNQQVFIAMMTIALFIVGSIFLGKAFFFKTLLSSILFPLFVYIFSFVPFQAFDNKLLASIFAGISTGASLALVFRTGASTGGMDIPALLLNKFFKISVGISVLIVDGLTVLLGYTSYGLEAVLIGIISVYTSSIAIDFVMKMSSNEAVSVLIISDRYPEIIQEIYRKLDKGCTILYGEGAFTRQEKKILLTVIRKNQYSQLIELCKEVDNQSFLIMQDAREVHGLGFSLKNLEAKND